jgi:hypothetical protein
VAVGVAIEHVPLTHSWKGRAVTHLPGVKGRAVYDMTPLASWVILLCISRYYVVQR